MNLFTRQKPIHRLREQTYEWQGREKADVGRDSSGVWDGHEHTAVFKVDNQQRPTV